MATGFWPDDDGTGMHELADLSKDRQGHEPAVWIERQQSILHAAGCREPAFADGELVDQRVGVDEVEVVACGNRRRLLPKSAVTFVSSP